MVQLLIEKGANLNAKSEYGETPLYLATKFKDITELLLSEGAEIDVKTADNYGTTLLHAAAQDGIKHLVEQLIKKGADINAKDFDRETPLYCAAHEGHQDIVELLLTNDAEVDLKAVNSNEWTLLHAAVYGGNKNLVEQLIAKGADVNAKTENGATPLHLAILQGHEEVADLLRKHGAVE